MSRTVEHIVETHRIATARRDAGRPIWDLTVNLADVFHNDELSFEQRRDAIVQRLYGSGWNSDVVYTLVADLGAAEDAGEFDEIWDEIYDHADFDRVWITTH